MTPDDMRQDIELKVVEMIKAKLSEGKMTEERSQAIAQHVLETLHPGMSFEELYQAIFHLDDMYGELSPIVLPIVRDYEQTVMKQIQKGVQDLIRQGRYDEAEQLANKAINGKLKLVWQGSSKAVAA
jgi:hypothetical protein